VSDAKPHDWESEIVGYRDQSEPKWVTTCGYMPPIRKYRCKNCEKTFTAESGYAIFILTTDVECPGKKDEQHEEGG
jgi:hypothetical protein